MKYYFQTTELDDYGKQVGCLAFDGYVEAEDRRTALRLARKEVNKTNAWHKKHHVPFEEYPDLPPPSFALTFLGDENDPRINGGRDEPRSKDFE